MTPRELGEAVRPALGMPPSFRVREALGRLLRGEASEIYVLYEEVKDWKAMEQVINHPDIELQDGAEGMKFYFL